MPWRVTIPWHTPLAANLIGALLVACSASSSRPLEGVDCNVSSAYELSAPLRGFEPSMDELWYSGADATGTSAPAATTTDPACGGGGGSSAAPTAAAGTGGSSTGRVSISVSLEPIEGEGRCGSQNAMVLRSTGHTDWGSVFGDWRLASAGAHWDGSGFDGLAIWARAGAGDRAVTLLLDTWQTSAAGTDASVDAGLVCKIDCNGGSGTQSRDEAGNVTSETYVSPPGTCGNSFQRVLELSSEWRLHLLPFSSFHQDLKPNMSPGGIDPTHINGLTIRVAKEASVELWIDDIAFYRQN